MARWTSVLVFFSSLTQIWAADFAGRRTLSENYQWNQKPLVKVAFFDADSTLRVSPKGGITAKDATDVMLLPFVGSAIKKAAEAGYLIAIVSNQGGIPDKISLKDSEKALLLTVDLIEQKGGKVHYLDFAEGMEGEGAEDLALTDRKPGFGMALRLEKILQEKFNSPNIRIDRTQSYMVGDSAYQKAKPATATKPAVELEYWPNRQSGTNFSNADRMFAQNFGIAFSYVREYFGYAKYGIDYFENAKQATDFFKKCVAESINCD